MPDEYKRGGKREMQAISQIALETHEQRTVVQWALLNSSKHPELKLLYAVPNGARVSRTQAVKLSLEGMKAGVPDLCLPVKRGDYNGLYVELKRSNGVASDVSQAQASWIRSLRKQGYAAGWFKGAEEAIKGIEAYLKAVNPGPWDSNPLPTERFSIESC